MGIAGLNLRFNKKIKTNVERESISYYKKSSDRATVSKKIIFSDDKLQRWINNYRYFVKIYK